MGSGSKKRQSVETAVALSAQWRYVALLACMVVGTILANRGELGRLFHKPFSEQVLYADEMRDGGTHLAKTARLEGSFDFSEEGLTLKPGDSFRAELHLSKELGQDVTLYVGLHTHGDVANRIDVVMPDGMSFYFPSLDYVPNVKLFVPEAAREYREFSVVVTATRNPESFAQPVVVFDSLRVVSETNRPLVNIPALLAVIAASLMAHSLLVRSVKFSRYGIVGASALFIILLAEVQYGNDQYLPASVVALGGLAVGWLSYVRKPEERFWRVWLRYSLLYIVIIGLQLRWNTLGEALRTALPPDAVTYAALARQMKAPFDTSIREPLFIWVVKLFFWVFGSSDTNLQLASLFLSLMTIVLVYIWGASMFHPFAALAGALFLAASREYIYQNTRGLRLELYVLILLLLMLVLREGKRMKPLHRVLLVGLVCGLSFLNNVSSLSYVIVLVVYFGVRQRWKWWQIAAPLVIGMILLSPHLYHNKKQFGDPLYSSNIHARFYRNAEFHGRPGFPTVEEVRKDGYAGARITTAQYIFGLHSASAVVTRSLAGFGRIYFGDHLRTYILDDNLTLYYLYLLGLLVLILTRQYDVLVVLFIVNVPSFFLAGTKPVNFDFRLTMHDIGFVTMCMGAGLVRGVSELARAINRVKAQGGEPAIGGARMRGGAVAPE